MTSNIKSSKNINISAAVDPKQTLIISQNKGIMNSVTKILLGSIFILLIISCAEPKKNISLVSEFYPKLNSFKNEIITVYGEMPRDLDVEFKTVWVAKNKEYDCKYDTKYNAKFVTITKGFYIPELINVEREKEKYKVRFYLDKYIPGYCKWGFDHLEYTAIYGDRISKNRGVVYQAKPKQIKSGLTFYCEPADSLNNLKCGNKKISPNGIIRVPLIDIYEKITPGYKKKDARVDVWCKKHQIDENSLFCTHWNERFRDKRKQHIRYGFGPETTEIRVNFHVKQ